jgi:hypothetical protein
VPASSYVPTTTTRAISVTPTSPQKKVCVCVCVRICDSRHVCVQSQGNTSVSTSASARPLLSPRSRVPSQSSASSLTSTSSTASASASSQTCSYHSTESIVLDVCVWHTQRHAALPKHRPHARRSRVSLRAPTCRCVARAQPGVWLNCQPWCGDERVRRVYC